MQANISNDLDLLAIRLRRTQSEYEWARRRGDAERLSHFRIQLSAINAERDRLIQHLGTKMSRGASTLSR